MKAVITCKICGNPLTGKKKYFCSIKCKNKSHQSYIQQQTRGLNRKLEILKRFGGKCSRCGYCKNLSALTFHHLVPAEKKFKLDIRSLSNRKLVQIELELQKCALVCHNCHAEIHHPQHNLA